MSDTKETLELVRDAKKKAGSLLFHLGEKFTNLLGGIDPQNKDDLQVLIDTMESLGFDSTVSDLLDCKDEIDGVIQGRTKKIKELQEKNRIDGNLVTKISETLLAMAVAMGRTTVGEPHNAKRIQYTKPGMEILDEDEIPTQYKETKPVLTKEAKAKLKAAVVLGEDIPGTAKTEGRPFFKSI